MEKHSFLLNREPDKYKKAIATYIGVGFCAGIVIANTLGRSVIMDLGIFGDYFFMQLQNVTIETSAMFQYVLEKRMLFILVVSFLGLTSFGVPAVYCVSGWIGISFGMLLSAAAMQRGIEGIVVCLTGLVPQGFIYLPMGFMLLLKACRMSAVLSGKEQRYKYNLKKGITTYFGAVLVVFLAFFVGILLESLLNPVFLRKIYKIFNNI